ncbi:hypothetical protein BT69DRAFT_939491, partial [Atractiella rhizophila]
VNGQSGPKLSNPSLSSIPSLIALFLRLASPTDISFLPPATSSTLISTGPSSNAPPVITDLVSSIHLRSLECLNNLLIVVARSATLPKEYASICQMTWKEVGRIAETTQMIEAFSAKSGGNAKDKGKDKEEMDIKQEVLEMCVGCLWALARAKVDESLGFSPEEIEFVKRLATNSNSSSIKLRAVGTLGCLASRTGVSIAENEAVGKLLFSFISQVELSIKDVNRLEVILQALDEIFDVYGDETRDYDIVFRRNDFIVSLRNARAQLKKTIKGIDKRKYPGLRSRAEGVWTNLDAYIEYREGLSFPHEMS